MKGFLQKIRKQDILCVVVIIGVAVLLRVLPHPANFSPIMAIALFGGVYLPKRLAFLLPIAVMLISDVFLGFHQSMPYVYLCFLLTTTMGFYLRERKSVGLVLGASIASAVVFFLITNFGFFLSYSLYPKTFSGQMTAYINGLPFFKNTLFSNLIYTGLLFGGYEAVLRVVRGGIHANLHKNRG